MMLAIVGFTIFYLGGAEKVCACQHRFMRQAIEIAEKLQCLLELPIELYCFRRGHGQSETFGAEVETSDQPACVILDLSLSCRISNPVQESGDFRPSHSAVAANVSIPDRFRAKGRQMYAGTQADFSRRKAKLEQTSVIM